MTRVLAIAAITLRSAIRSRVVVSLLVILLVTIIGLPLTVKGDGTVSGTMQVLLTYTLGMVSLILSLVTLWAACAAISIEVAERQIHLVVTKPVSRAQIWLGKWVGLMALNAVLLAICGATVIGILQWKKQRGELAEEERTELETQILVAREKVGPKFPDVSVEARELLQAQREGGAVPADISEEDALSAMARVLLTRRHSAVPGQTLTWTFRLPKVPEGKPLHFQFRFDSSDQSTTQIPGRWRIGDPESPHVFEHETFSTPGGIHTLVAPPEAVSEDGSLHVEYTNLNQFPVATLFSPTDGPHVFVYRGAFTGNLVRALTIRFFHIAFLAALGVTAGSLFSMPVASFLSLFIMVMLYSVGYVESLASRPLMAVSAEETGFSIIHIFSGAVFRMLSFILSPLKGANPLELLGIGELVPWSTVASVFVIKIVVYSGILGIVGNGLFNRRELGLPS